MLMSRGRRPSRVRLLRPGLAAGLPSPGSTANYPGAVAHLSLDEEVVVDARVLKVMACRREITCTPLWEVSHINLRTPVVLAALNELPTPTAKQTLPGVLAYSWLIQP